MSFVLGALAINGPCEQYIQEELVGAQQQGTHAGIRAGVTLGAALAVLALVVTVLYDLGVLPGVAQAVEFLVALVGFGLAGFLTSRQTGRAKSGAVAGLIASMFPVVIIQGANVLVAVISPATFARWFGYHDVAPSQLIIAALVQAVVGVILWGVLGILLGALGGLIGRKRLAAAQPA